MASVLRQRNFRLLWTAETISELGSTVTIVAFPLVAIGVLNASNFEVAVITAASTVAWLAVALPAGVWVDRWPRRPVMVVTDLGRALLLASVPVAWALHVLSVAQLVLVALGTGVLTVFFNIANTAFMSSVVEADRLADGNSALQASSSAAAIAGPGLGGGLVQLAGAPVALVADAVSFLVSAACVYRIRSGEARPAPVAGRRLRTEVAEGMRYVFTTPLTRVIAISMSLANFVFGGFEAVVFVFLIRQLGLRPALVGTLFAIGAVGGLIGSVLAGRLTRWLGDARLIVVSSVVTTAGGLLLPLATEGWGLAWFVAGMLSMDVAIAAFNVCVVSAVQGSTPAPLLGRVVASTRVFSRGGMAAGALIGGVLATAISPRGALAALMALQVLTPLRIGFSPIGRVRRLADLAPPASPTPSPAGSAPPPDEPLTEERHSDIPDVTAPTSL